MNWISVDKVKPQDYSHVLIWISDSIGCSRPDVGYIGKYSGEHPDEKDIYWGWFNSDEKRFEGKTITHWAPLPDGPQGEIS